MKSKYSDKDINKMALVWAASLIHHAPTEQFEDYFSKGDAKRICKKIKSMPALLAPMVVNDIAELPHII